MGQRLEPADTMSTVLAPGTASYLMSVTSKGPDGSWTDNVGVIFQSDEEATDAWDNVAAKEQMKEKLAPFVGETRQYRMLFALLASFQSRLQKGQRWLTKPGAKQVARRSSQEALVKQTCGSTQRTVLIAMLGSKRPSTT